MTRHGMEPIMNQPVGKRKRERKHREKSKQFRYAKRNRRTDSKIKRTDAAPLFMSIEENQTMLSGVFGSWRLRWHSIKHNCSGYVKQFQEKKQHQEPQSTIVPCPPGPAV
jgi:hypothetical protein